MREIQTKHELINNAESTMLNLYEGILNGMKKKQKAFNDLYNEEFEKSMRKRKRG
jgi:hypothetical protein